nr:hypothetical protein [Tanacetum cinerariifolium]
MFSPEINETHIPLRPNLGVLQIGIKSQDIVISDSEDSTVTYTSISNYEEPSNVGSSRVVVYGYDGLLMHPPSPDYVPCPEHPPSPAYVLEFVPEPVYPKFMPPEDDVLPAEEQPLLAAASPTARSPGYVTESDLEEDPEEEVALQAPPSPDYIPGPEDLEQAPPSPDYVPGPEHVNDEIVAKDQPYAEDASPIAQSPEYVPES